MTAFGLKHGHVFFKRLEIFDVGFKWGDVASTTTRFVLIFRKLNIGSWICRWFREFLCMRAVMAWPVGILIVFLSNLMNLPCLIVWYFYFFQTYEWCFDRGDRKDWSGVISERGECFCGGIVEWISKFQKNFLSFPFLE